MDDQTILVVGATGTQGGAVARALMEQTDANIQGLTRDASNPRALDLEERGISVVEGDLSDPERLTELFEDVDAVFGVTDFWEHGYDREIKHGRNLARAVEEAGIEHFVFSSVGGADRDSGISHFESKRRVEERIEELDLPVTILRPVFFLQNLEGMREQVVDGTLAMGLAPRVPLQMVDVENLGALAAQAFQNPDFYMGETIEVASDELTLQAAAVRLTEVIGRQVDAQHLSSSQVEAGMGEEYRVMFDWFNEHGYESDLTALRAEHDVDWTLFEAYLEREGWGKIEG